MVQLPLACRMLMCPVSEHISRRWRLPRVTPSLRRPQGSYVVHIFPPCDFANENMARIAPDLLSAVAEVPHLVIVIATC